MQCQPNQSLTKLEEVLSPATFRKVTGLNLEWVLVFHVADLCNSLNRDCNYPLNQFLTGTEAITGMEMSKK